MLLKSEVEIVVVETVKTFIFLLPLYLFPAGVWWYGSILVAEVEPALETIAKNVILILAVIMLVLNTFLLILRLVSNCFSIFSLMFIEANSFEEEYEAFKEVLPLAELVKKLRLRKTEPL